MIFYMEGVCENEEKLKAISESVYHSPDDPESHGDTGVCDRS